MDRWLVVVVWNRSGRTRTRKGGCWMVDSGNNTRNCTASAPTSADLHVRPIVQFVCVCFQEFNSMYKCLGGLCTA